LQTLRKYQASKIVLLEKSEFISQSKNIKDFQFSFAGNYLCVDDNTQTTGFDVHYTYHPAWALRKVINEIKPQKHIDISSAIYFSTSLSASIPVEFYDFRPAELKLSNLLCSKADLTNLFFETNSIESLSCMHTVEHVGLGRYGDEIDPIGDIKAMKELQRVVAQGKHLLFVVPIGGENKIHFNAHRVYKPEFILKQFDLMDLKEFYYISGDNKDQISAHPSQIDLTKENYGCGCFWFIKK